MSYRSYALFSADSPHQVSPMHPAPWRDPPVLNDLETAVALILTSSFARYSLSDAAPKAAASMRGCL